MSTRMPWGSYRASAHIDTKTPRVFFHTVPWLGVAFLKLWPILLTINWPVNL